MRIRCRECKTVFDSKDKYCPYCYARADGRKSHMHLNGQVDHVKETARLRTPTRETQQKAYAYRMKQVRSSQRKQTRNMSFSKIWSEVIVPLIAIFIIFAVLTRLWIF